MTIEAVGVDAGQLDPGSYRLRVTVRDLLGGGQGSSREVELELLD